MVVEDGNKLWELRMVNADLDHIRCHIKSHSLGGQYAINVPNLPLNNKKISRIFLMNAVNMCINKRICTS